MGINPYFFSSGRVDTNGLFSPVYGWFEARLDTVPTDGVQTAWWMWPDNGLWNYSNRFIFEQNRKLMIKIIKKVTVGRIIVQILITLGTVLRLTLSRRGSLMTSVPRTFTSVDTKDKEDPRELVAMNKIIPMNLYLVFMMDFILSDSGIVLELGSFGVQFK